LFEVTGNDYASLAAEDFATEVSIGHRGNDATFVTRYQDVASDEEESDFAPGTVVPLPPAGWAGFALLGVVGLGHLWRKQGSGAAA